MKLEESVDLGLQLSPAIARNQSHLGSAGANYVASRIAKAFI